MFSEHEFERRNKQRFLHACFGLDNSVCHTLEPLSSGFHQVMPMVIQAALMWRYEMLAIENPEVHLHPSLQLNTMDFLIQQALTGRTIMIETHSDLVVRRTIRSLLEEGISQEEVRLYFVDIKKSQLGCHYSTLNSLQVNERGQIQNWPEGFMDDDLKESQRLMNIMYDIPFDDEEEE